jgi:hypothetical protein
MILVGEQKGLILKVKGMLSNVKKINLRNIDMFLSSCFGTFLLESF